MYSNGKKNNQYFETPKVETFKDKVIKDLICKKQIYKKIDMYKRVWQGCCCFFGKTI